MLPTKFKVNKPFDSGEEVKNRFSRWPLWKTSWISDQKDFSYFWPMSTRCFLPSFESIGFFSLGEEAKNRFSRWLPKQPSWISDRDDFSFFLSTSHPNASCQVSSQLAFQFRRSEKLILKWPPWRPSWISDRDDFSYFWSISHPNTSYQVWSQLAFEFRKRSEK